MREIAKLKGKEFPKQINLSVTEEFYERWKRLKAKHRIDTPEEARGALLELLDRLEHNAEKSA